MPFITKENDDKKMDIYPQKSKYIVDSKVVVKRANGGGSMNRFNRSKSKNKS
jgi:hypothetical protein